MDTLLLAKNRQYIVVSCPEMEWLSKELAAKKPKLFIPNTIDWECFPDGTPNIFIHNMDKIKNRHILFLASSHDFKSKYMQLAAMFVLTRSKVRTLTVSMPFMNTATMERVSNEGEVATAHVDAWLYSSLPACGTPVEFIVYDLHTLQNRLYFHSTAIPTMATGINILKDRLEKVKEEFPDEKLAICFPDDGASKRFSSMFDGYPLIVCKKVRRGNQRVVTISEGEPSGYHVVIVDDLVQTGGTLANCKTAMLEAGAMKVSGYVTHGIFPNETWRRFTPKPHEDVQGWTYFFVTNTFPTSSQVEGVAPFEVLSFTDDLMTHLLADTEKDV